LKGKRWRRLTCLGLITAVMPAVCGARGSPGKNFNAKASLLGTDFSVLEHHNGPSRSGVYVHPAFTRNAAPGIHLEFATPIEGVVNAQPLFLDNQGEGPDIVFVVTEQNQVFAIDAMTGVLIWNRKLDPPLPRKVIIDVLGDCGSFDPIGITGTPVMDEIARAIYLDLVTPDDERYARHLVYGLSLDDGSTLPGWPVDVGKSVPGFSDIVQNQRGALTLLNDVLYVPYGSYTDCGDFRGWLVGIATFDTALVGAWSPDAFGAGIWAPSGVASDGTSLFIATGNGGKTKDWGGGEAIIRLDEGPSFSGLPVDYFTPLSWPILDVADQDLGSSGVLLLDSPGASATGLAAAFGKAARLYLADRSNLGGMGGALLEEMIALFVIITAPSTYTTAQGTYVVFSGFGYVINCPGGENISSIQINPTSPVTISTAWCASAPGLGATMVTASDGASDSIVWVVGAGADDLLYGFDGDNGELIALSDGANDVFRYTAPIAAKGRIYVAGTDWLFAFALK
jgi:hypothetical protein